MTDPASDLEQWLGLIERSHPRAIELGLDRCAEVAGRLQLLDAGSATVISVAGTNGKGSCVRVMESLLQAGGARVGAYTSPHLRRYNERVRMLGSPVGDAALCEAFAAVEAARGEVALTYFEYGTLAALYLFQRQALDFWLLEVGLGGRLDAVNIVDADIAVVTSVDLDHTEWLGTDRESIGAEKAGIFRRGRPVVCGDRKPPDSLRAQSRALAAPCFAIGEAFDWSGEEDGSSSWIGTDAEGHRIGFRSRFPTELHGDNIACALQALALAGIDVLQEQIMHELARVSLEGRRQSLCRGGVEYLLDVAHNPAGTRLLAGHLASLPARGKTAVVFAAMEDKDIGGMLDPLLALVQRWFVPQLDAARAAAPGTVARYLRERGAEVSECATVAEAMRAARAYLPCGGRMLVCGSFHTVGPALDWLDDCRADIGAVA